MDRQASDQTFRILAEAVAATIPSMTVCFRYAFNAQIASDTWEVKAPAPASPRSFDVI